MEHMAWKGRIKPGCKEKYQRRHAEIWPEMVEVLKEAGICNYSIFYCNDELFGYYECEKGVAYAEKSAVRKPCCRSLERVHEGHSGAGNGPCNGRPAQAGAGVPAGLRKCETLMQSKAPAAYGSGGFCHAGQFTAHRRNGRCRSSAHRQRTPAPDPDPSPGSNRG